ncbi:hypothetical protein AB5I41_02730 [Sphingomonas sp. MMS24-JH45]
MATNAETNTADAPTLTLTPPDPVPTVQAERAAGLVPVDQGTRTELESASTGSSTTSSPRTPTRPISASASTPSRRWVRRRSATRRVSRTASSIAPSAPWIRRPASAPALAELRRVVEDLDPGKRGNLTAPQQFVAPRPSATRCGTTSTATSRRRPTSAPS